jgi:hypothetical protein
MLFSGHACRSSEEQAPKIAFANTREAGDISPAARGDRASDHRRALVAAPILSDGTMVQRRWVPPPFRRRTSGRHP